MVLQTKRSPELEEALGPGSPIVVFDGVSDAVNYQLERVLTNERYYRLQVELTLASDDLDDASEHNLRDLRRQAEELVEARSADLDAVLAKLESKARV